MVRLANDFPGNLISADVCYTQVGLMSYRVETIRDISDLLAERVAASKRKAELEQIRRLAAGEAVGRRAKRPKRARDGKGKGGKKRDKGDKHDSHDGGSAHDASGSDGGIDEEGRGSDEDDDGVEDPGVDGHSSRDGDDDDSDASSEQPPGPRVEPSGRVKGPDGEYLGRISVMRVGAPTEALSVYCGRHGCSVCIRVSRGVPSQAAILRWFQAGLALPRDRSAHTQRVHKDSFPGADE